MTLVHIIWLSDVVIALAWSCGSLVYIASVLAAAARPHADSERRSVAPDYA